MMDDYYESQEVEAARTELLAASARESADAGGRAGRPGGRPISISLAPLKSAVFGRWYDDVRPLLRRQLGLKAELPEPVYTEVPTRDSLDSLLARPRRPHSVRYGLLFVTWFLVCLYVCLLDTTEPHKTDERIDMPSWDIDWWEPMC